VSVRAVKAYGGSAILNPLILDSGSKWK